MANRLTGKVAFITGGSSGIGKSTAILFAQEGAQVVICGRKLDALNGVVSEIQKSGGKIEAVQVDVSHEDQITQAIETVAAKYGRLDILVNNAMAYSWGAIETTSTDDWKSNFSTTVDGTFWATRAALKVMKPQGSGSIVNMSSICGVFGMAWMAGYSAAKAAIINFTKAVAAEVGPSGVRCNSIIPGVVDTPATSGMLADEKSKSNTEKLIPLKRVGHPEELAKAILFLASDDSSYITGASLPVDGGRSAELYTVLE